MGGGRNVGMLLALHREKWWLAVNAVGLVAFLYLASETWREPELRGQEVATAGVAFVWALSALPVLFVFFVIDVVWLSRAIALGFRSQEWRPTVVAMGAGAIWVGAVVLDHINH
jgi:hypothetical protein